jgi:hypothetical protein
MRALEIIRIRKEEIYFVGILLQNRKLQTCFKIKKPSEIQRAFLYQKK